MFEREELIREAQALDPLPASSMQLSRILSKEDWSLEEVAKTAALDQALTGRLLRFANSAASGSQAQVTSVNMAVMRMGPGMVLSVAVGEGVRTTMDTSLPAYGLDEGGLFRHSVATAMAIATMRSAKLDPPPGAFIAALVHDVGKLVIGRKLKKLGITLSHGDPGTPWVRDEAEQLGIDHAELSGSIARSWDLPAGIPEAVEHHHRPEELEPGPIQRMTHFVAAADAIAHALEDDGAPAWDPVAAEHLGLDPAAQAQLRTATGELLERVLQIYS